MAAIAATGNGYVAAAYLAFLFLVLSYLAIMAVKLGRIEREVVEISELVESRDGATAREPAKESVA
jgi:hypothetical protein